MSTRLRAYLVTVPLLVAMLLPLGWPAGRDDFPISSYPMFTKKRDPVMDVVHVLAVAEDGRQIPVSPDYVANGAVMQAAATIRRAIANQQADLLCAQVAKNLPPSLRTTTSALVVATSTYDLVRYFREPDGRRPRRRVEHARCQVLGGALPP